MEKTLWLVVLFLVLGAGGSMFFLMLGAMSVVALAGLLMTGMGL